mmetsp:Transcript_11724/g.17934  ORF Transcript_11724/g.17934 Transcript_11724/m.17934 type:complete len:320 (+) Transcript_11724:685-1644(+)
MRGRRVEDLLELLVELNEVVVDTLEVLQLAHAVELLVDLTPLEVIEPVGWVGLGVNGTTGSSQEEAPLTHVDLVISEEDLSAEQEREQKLVGLEQGSADVLVQGEGEVVVQDSDTGSGFVVGLGVFHTSSEQSLEPLKRVLVHGIDVSQVHNTEEEQTGSEGDSSEVLTSLIDLLLGNSRDLLLLFDLSGYLLRVGKDIDEVVITEEVHDLSCITQSEQDLVLQFVGDLGVSGVRFHDLIFLPLEVRELKLHKLIEHLLLETELSDSEVEQADLHLGFGCVVRVRQRRRQEELERIVVGDRLVTELDDIAGSLLDLLLQ